MGADSVSTERRTFPRFTGEDMQVALRQRGRISRTSTTVVDFNRFGVAVLLDEPLAKEKQVFLSLRCGEVRLDNIIGVVHNCIARGDQYRCGIQFRTQSSLQFDRNLVENTLLQLESGFAQPRVSGAENPSNGPEQSSATQ